MASTNKPSSQKRADRERQDNRTLSRVYYVFLFGLAAECYLFMVYRGFANASIGSTLAWSRALTVEKWLGLAALVIGTFVGLWKRKDKKIRTVMIWAACIGAFFYFSSLIMLRFFHNGLGVTIMCFLVPIVAVMTIIYLLYQHECALSTVILGGAMFSVWLRSASVQSERWRVPVMIGCVLVVVLLSAAYWLVNMAKKDTGGLWGRRVFSLECDYRVVFAVIIAAAVCVLLVAVLPAAAYYLMWVLGILLFAELVYYTTKLM